MRYFKSILLAVMAAFVGVAQGQVDEDQFLAVAVDLGRVKQATVNFYKNDGETLFRSKTTDQKGRARINAGGYKGVIVIEVVATQASTYFDEAAGTLLRLRPGSTMYALVPRASFADQVSVTPVTSIAYGLARAQELFPLSGCEVFELNDIVRDSITPGLRRHILSLPTPFTANTTRGSLNNTVGGRYAVTLAALAKLGEDRPAPALAALNVLKTDSRDGVIDGRINRGRLVIPRPLYLNFKAEMRANIRDVVNAFGSSGLRQLIASLTPARIILPTGEVEANCPVTPPPPPPTGGTGGTGGTGSGGGGI